MKRGCVVLVSPELACAHGFLPQRCLLICEALFSHYPLVESAAGRGSGRGLVQVPSLALVQSGRTDSSRGRTSSTDTCREVLRHFLSFLLETALGF